MAKKKATKKTSKKKTTKKKTTKAKALPAAEAVKPTKKKATASKSKKAPAKPVAAALKGTAAPTYDQIAARAFEVWERKGKPDGQDAANWKEAEAELLAEAGQG